METVEDNIEEIKQMLRSLKEKDIIFNEPHFTQQLILREGNKSQIIQYILNPSNLVYSYQEMGKHGDTIHCFHFKISNNRTLRLPVIFKKKGLYVLTYIMRYRKWQNMLKVKK